MAACGIGPSGLKIKKVDFGSTRPQLIMRQPLHGLRTTKVVRFDGLGLLHRPKKPMIVCRSTSSEEDWEYISSKASVEDDSKETVTTEAVSSLIPKGFELESLLNLLCDTKSIAEIELKHGGFWLRVSRKLAEQSAPPQYLAHVPATAQEIGETSGTNGSASSPSLALFKHGGVESQLDIAKDAGLMILQSPKVGHFRRSRTIKGKKAPPPCKESDTVKEGQVLCYIEQLGCEVPIESDVSGEVVKILREDGDLVGYGDALIAVLPSAPEIMEHQ